MNKFIETLMCFLVYVTGVIGFYGRGKGLNKCVM